MTVHEQHRVGTPLGSSPGRSRIFRRAYDDPAYVRLAVRANAEWRALDPTLLRTTGLLLDGPAAVAWGDAMAEAGEPGQWLEPHEAQRMFPEARFAGPVLSTQTPVRSWQTMRCAPSPAASTCASKAASTTPARSTPTWSRCAPDRGFGSCTTCRCGAGSNRSRISAERRTTGPRWSISAAAGTPAPTRWSTPGVGYKVAEHEVRGEWDPDRPDRPVQPEITARLVEYVRERFPGLDPEPVHSEACLYTLTPDNDFIVDAIDGVIVCGGDSGHAFKFGPLLGRLVADLAQGRALPVEAERFRVGRLAQP